MLAGISEDRHYEMHSYLAEITEAEKQLASEYDALHLKPPPLKGINENTKAFAYDVGQVLYAIKVVKIGPYQVCAGWMVTTRGPELPPSFYVGPCKKTYTSGGFDERRPSPTPTQPHSSLGR